MKGGETVTSGLDLEALKRQQREFYQRNAKYYRLIGQQFESGYAYDHVLEELVGRVAPPARFLDIGAGSGYYVERGRRLGCRSVGIDLSLHSCRMGAEKSGGRFCQADAEWIPFRDGCFDLVFCQQLLEHVVFPERVVAEIARVLRPGGLLFLSAPNRLGRHTLPKIRRVVGELVGGAEVKHLRPLAAEVLARWNASDDIDLLQDTDMCNETTVFQALRLVRRVGLTVERFDTLRHPRKYSWPAYVLARLANRLPLIRYTGVNFKLVARKPNATPKASPAAERA